MNRDDVPLIVEDSIDFAGYLAQQEAPKVLPVGHWLETEAEEREEPSGYRYPWRSLEGRFAMRPHELTLWTGYAKHGKSTALGQAVLCAIAQGARVGIISLEFAVLALIKVLRWQSLGITRGGLTADDRDLWREWIDGHLWLYDHHGMQEGVRIAAACWHMARNLECDVVVVDSLMMCGVKTDGEGFATAQTEFVNRLLNVVRAHPCHLHLVAHARKERDDSKPAGLLDVSGHGNLVNLPHSVVSIWRNRTPKEKRTEDAVFWVLGDRVGGHDGALKLWWHETARQYVEGREELPTRYAR